MYHSTLLQITLFLAFSSGALSLPSPIIASSSSISPPIPPRSTSSRIQCHATAPTIFDQSHRVLDPRSCLSICGPISPDHSAFLHAAGDAYECLCVHGDDMRSMETAQCTSDSWYAYTPYIPWDDEGIEVPRDEEDDAQMGVKGDDTVMMVLQTKRDGMKVLGLCEEGLKACTVRGQDSSYECLDVSSTARSCGSCAAGEYVMGGVNTTALGTDCTALPGVAEGAAACIAGRCVISGCTSGYDLVGGHCVRI